MIIYNVTIKINHDVHDEWLQWMKSVHIPEVMNTGLFLENRICKLLLEDEDGVSYAFQYNCESIEKINEYRNNHAVRLQNAHTERYKDKFVGFRTLLEVI